jgi:predicted house-cleaning NTP pyrophosphatase (Maf/HAM1 superfamily)
MIQGYERTVPRNHYTTAPLVITRDTRMTCKRNQEHKQEQERNATKIVLITGGRSHKPITATLFDDRIDLSKTRT